MADSLTVKRLRDGKGHLTDFCHKSKLIKFHGTFYDSYIQKKEKKKR